MLPSLRSRQTVALSTRERQSIGIWYDTTNRSEHQPMHATVNLDVPVCPFYQLPRLIDSH
eukprot:scaffold7522_cov417-Prasinococcus_capsulatus_cf.AAC.8